MTFRASVVSSLTHTALGLVGAHAVGDSVACAGADATAVAWQTLLSQHAAVPGARARGSVPGGPSDCKLVLGPRLSTLAILWNSLPAQHGPVMETVLASTPGVEVTGQWRVLASAATIRNAAARGDMPPFDSDTVTMLNGDTLSGEPFRRWLYTLGWQRAAVPPVERERHFGDAFIAQMLGRVEYDDGGNSTGVGRTGEESEVDVGVSSGVTDTDDSAPNARYLTTVDVPLPDGSHTTLTLEQLAGTGPFVVVALHEAEPVFVSTPDGRLASSRLHALSRATTAIAPQYVAW